MYFLIPMCCICLKSKKLLEVLNLESLTKLFYCAEKIEKCITPISNQMQICKECLDKLEVTFYFKQMCLRNVIQFKDYIGQLERVYSNTFNVAKVKLFDIKCQAIKDQLITLSVEQNLDERVVTENETSDNTDMKRSESTKCQEQYLGEKLSKQDETTTQELKNQSTNKYSAVKITLPEFKQEETECNEHTTASVDQPSNIHFENTFMKENVLGEMHFQSYGSTEYHKQERMQDQFRTIAEFDSQTFACCTCGKCFTNDISLRAHMHYIHHCCFICGKCFTNNSALKMHTSTHTDNRPFSCLICGATFKLKHHLNRHKLSHTNYRPHSCPTCGKGFIRKSDLTRHMLVHNKTQPNASSIWGKS